MDPDDFIVTETTDGEPIAFHKEEVRLFMQNDDKLYVKFLDDSGLSIIESFTDFYETLFGRTVGGEIVDGDDTK